MKKLNNKGFTLVELIIVIAILAIIMLIAIPNFSGIQQRMQVRADKATAAQIGKAVRVWFTDCTTDENLIAGDTTATIIPSELESPTDDKTVILADYSKLKGIDSYVTTNYRAASLKDKDKKAYDDDADASNGTGGFYGIFLTAPSTDAGAKIAVTISTEIPSTAMTTIEGITKKTVEGVTVYEAAVNYDGNITGTAGGGVAYVEP